MNSSTRVLVACLAALLTSGVLAQNVKAPKAQVKNPVRWALHPALMGPAVECMDDDRQCDVTVKMTPGTAGGVSVCLATVPGDIKVKVRSGFPPAKTIAWNLTPPTSTGVEYSFEPKYGILVLHNANGQLEPGNIGTSKAQFVIKNKRKKKGDSIYLPIIVQTDTATGIVTLCAASDPKIVNE